MNILYKIILLGIITAYLDFVPIGCSENDRNINTNNDKNNNNNTNAGNSKTEIYKDPERPNIVWIVLDHVAFKQIKTYYGSNGQMGNVMSAYSRIASEGMEFNNAYSVCPLCSPARASMFTGQYPHNHGVTQNGDLSERKGFEPGTRVFGQYLNDRGYEAGYFGKVHVGAGTANNFGFEGWSMNGYGNPYGSPRYSQYLKELNIPEPEVRQEWATDRSPVRKFKVTDISNYSQPGSNGFRAQSSGVMNTPSDAHEAFFVANLASQWLEKDREKDKPFVLRVDFWGPHQPYYVTEPFANTISPEKITEYPNFSNDFDDRPEYHKEFRDENRSKNLMTSWKLWQPVVARDFENIKEVDAAANRVLETLDKLGLSDNTIVIYTADHGDAIATNGGLFDKGAMMIEETMNIPMVIRWPGVVQKGARSDAFVSNLDLVPTVLDAAGAQNSGKMDGKSMVGLLKTQEVSTWREELVCESYGHNNDVFQRYVRYKNYKYVAHLKDMDELYDLQKDPYEMKNLINDPAMGDVLKDIRARLIKNMESTGDNSAKAKALIEQITH